MDTVASLASVRANTPIEAVVATVKSVGEYITGSGNFGPYSFQDVMLTDGQNEYLAVFGNRNELPKDVVGQTLLLKSVMSKKNGLVGLKVKPNKKGELVLSVTATAVVEDAPEEGESEDGDLAPAAPAPTQSRLQPAAPRAAAAKPAAPAARSVTPAGAVKDAKTYLNRAANLMELCLDAADFIKGRYEATHGGDGAMTDEQYKAIVSTLFINASKEGLADSMPTGTLDEFKSHAD